MKLRFVTTSIILGSVFLTGCATQLPPEPPAQVQRENPLLISLAESARQIQSAAQEVKMINAAIQMPKLDDRQAKAMAAAEAYVPPQFRQVVSVPQFEGQPEKLLQAIADGIGWKFKTYGERPALNEVISKSYREKQIIDIVKDLGYSINSGDVVLNEKEKTIVLQYKR